MQFFSKTTLFCVLIVGFTLTLVAQNPRTEAYLEKVGVDEQLGETLPLDLSFIDEAGQSVTLQDYFDGEHPVILNFVYHDCPMLCNLVLDGLVKGISDIDWLPGTEYKIITISFDPKDTPVRSAEVKKLYLERLNRDGASAGWHFLTGNEADILKLADAAGFKYTWDPAIEQYAHPAVLTFVSGEGKVSRYLYGIEYSTRNTQTALLEAADGKVIDTVDRLLLYCYQYDPQAGSFVLQATQIMKLGGVIIVILLGSMLLFFWRREYKARPENTTKISAN